MEKLQYASLLSQLQRVKEQSQVINQVMAELATIPYLQDISQQEAELVSICFSLFKAFIGPEPTAKWYDLKEICHNKCSLRVNSPTLMKRSNEETGKRRKVSFFISSHWLASIFYIKNCVMCKNERKGWLFILCVRLFVLSKVKSQ